LQGAYSRRAAVKGDDHDVLDGNCLGHHDHGASTVPQHLRKRITITRFSLEVKARTLAQQDQVVALSLQQ
jgi:hypothetical protein